MKIEIRHHGKTVVSSSPLTPQCDDARKNSPKTLLLSESQCMDCPLPPSASSYCPSAESVWPFYSFFKNKTDSANTVVSFINTDSVVVQNLTDDDAAFLCLMGAVMHSNCPKMSKYRWMWKFYPPETNDINIFYMLLTSNFMARLLKGKVADLESARAEIPLIYSRIATVFSGMNSRFSGHRGQGQSFWLALERAANLGNNINETFDEFMEEIGGILTSTPNKTG